MAGRTAGNGATLSFLYRTENFRTSGAKLSHDGHNKWTASEAPLPSMPGRAKEPAPAITTYPNYPTRSAAGGTVSQTNWPLSAIIVAIFLMVVTAASIWKIWEILACCSGWNL